MLRENQLRLESNIQNQNTQRINHKSGQHTKERTEAKAHGQALCLFLVLLFFLFLF
jgi:hypothetical protein